MPSASAVVSRILLILLVFMALDGGGALAQQSSLRDPDVRVDCPCGLYPNSAAQPPRVVLLGDTAYAAYLDRRYFLSTEPYFTVSVNQGGTWNTTDRRLNNEPAGFPEGDMSQVQVLPAPDGRVYTLFATNDGPVSVPYVRTSPDKGQSWPTPALALTVADSNSRSDFGIAHGGPSIAYAFWVDNTNNPNIDRSIWLRRTVDGGATWLSRQQVNVNDVAPLPALPDPRERSTEPVACTDGANALYLAWKDKRDLNLQSFIAKPGRVLFRRSIDRGATFQAEVRLDAADARIETESQRPAIACNATGAIAVAWEDMRAGADDPNVYVNVSTDGGVSWRPAEVRVDDGAPGKQARKPRVAMGAGSPPAIFVAWEDDRSGAADLYFSRSTDGGATWSTPQRMNLGVDPGTVAVESWDLAADGDEVTLAWADNRNGSVSRRAADVFTISSSDRGATFRPPQRIDLGTGPGVADSTGVALSTAAGSYVAVYRDSRNHPDQAGIYGGGFGKSFDPRDPDADGLALDRDNCPEFQNPGQEDGDFDGVGNACDNFPTDPSNDTDCDGFPASGDNCPLAANATQANVDADPFGDACDLCVGTVDDIVRDLDGDGVGDACDTDVDGDALLDAADSDDDNDGVVDSADNCRTVRNARQQDDDRDGTGNVCDLDDLRVQALRVTKTRRGSPLVDWEREAAAVAYNAYFGLADRLVAGHPGFCLAPDIKAPLVTAALVPEPGQVLWYLATAKSATAEGSAGRGSDGTERRKPPCTPALAADWDADGVANNLDNCRFDANAGQGDADGDGTGDPCDRFAADPINDSTDSDGVGTDVDNCVFTANANQLDSDNDGVGDACDGCPAAYDPLQGDMDRDGIGDACDPDTDGDRVPNGADADLDGDGVPNGADNCVFTMNFRQTDGDRDGMGDACDLGGREVLGLGVSKEPDRLTWTRSSGATSYTVHSGFVTDLANGPPLGSCLQPPTSLPFADVPNGLIAGQSRWYLVQATYADGPGSAGRDSAGVEREVSGCP